MVVLIIFPVILQTVVNVLMLSIAGQSVVPQITAFRSVTYWQREWSWFLQCCGQWSICTFCSQSL